MSACIYHDAEAVQVCPSCEFAVCQGCLDGGAEGLCQTCYEELSARGTSAAAQPATELVRCQYCRAPEEPEAPLDAHGYCPSCRLLPRCADHEDLIAFGHCKSCRKQFCRKCLGFEDICPACMKRAVPPKAVPPAKGARPAAEKKRAPGQKGPPGKKSAAAERSPADKKKRPAAARAPAPLKGAEAPKKKTKTRGLQAMEDRLRARAEARRWPLRAVMAIGGATAAVLLLAAWFRPVSEIEYYERMRDQMWAAHRAIALHYRETQTLPANAAAFAGSPALRRLRLVRVPTGPGQVIYERRGDGFSLKASGQHGGVLKLSGEVFELTDQDRGPEKGRE